MTKARKVPAACARFETPPLEPADELKLIQTGLQSLTDLVRHSRLEGGPILWSLDSDADGVRIFTGIDPLAPPNVNITLCGVMELQGTLVEAASLFVLDSTDAVRQYRARFSKDIADYASLYTLAPRTPEHPRNYIGVKWLAVGMPSPLVKDRDFCLLECQDDFTFNGVRGWARSFSSIQLPSCPPFPGLVRANLFRAGYVFFESTLPGHLKCVHVIQSDFAGALPAWLVRAAMKRRVRSIVEIDTFLRQLRLCGSASLTDDQLVPLSTRRSCFLCSTKFSPFVAKRQCRKCGEVVCKHCSKLWELRGTCVCVCHKCATGAGIDLPPMPTDNNEAPLQAYTCDDEKLQHHRPLPRAMQVLAWVALLAIGADAAKRTPSNPIWKDVLALPNITSIETTLTTDGTYLEVRYDGAKETLKTISRVSSLCLTGVSLPDGLKKFSLNRVSLKTIPKGFTWPASLTHLDLSSNKLTSYPTTTPLPDGLGFFSLSNNKIKSFNDYFTWPSNLTELNLASNQFSSVVKLPSTLTKLDLSGNPLKTIDAQQQWPETLTELALTNTQLAVLPANLPSNLNIVHLASNKIAKFPSKTDFPDSIHYIGLTHNKITSLPSKIEWPNLFTLELDSNAITSIPDDFSLPASVGILALDANKITKLPANCDWLAHLSSITLRDNAISAFTSTCTLPNAISLQNNNITALQDMALPQQMDVSNNPISKINRVTFPEGVFWTTSKFELKEFSLSSDMFDLLSAATDRTYFYPQFTTDDASVKAACGYGTVKKLHDFPISICVVG
ncbi:hypothetical protein SDRG_12926 [Saprolegnia diclina VS20]|uniref:FYVE-type domain-containing protein n=1 Tax=Saprolegnia diclina (strain VS20) TaxID=1156394 RepID=T0RAP0_SAPDV|nr:hypothetical protein SDRG_12926 [Saprolegnia diclina VS20]EQC29258.1 hypothetical protein SDRG_12926 [Saprolegnia diclina VS20]|eukprot:XP_008617232.1 hypothetical protein SDRG_12926 [Saprolegnia diclina VS20]